jgi:hypothetical protein
MGRSKQQLMDKIAAAKQLVDSAGSELDALLLEIPAEPRAQKMAVSEVVQSAFDKLRAARSDVSRLEELLTSKPPGTR